MIAKPLAVGLAAVAPGDVKGSALKANNVVPEKVGEYTAEKIDATSANYNAPGKKTVLVLPNKNFTVERVTTEMQDTQPIGQLGVCGESKASPGEYMCALTVDGGGIMRLGAFKGATMTEMVAFAAKYAQAVGTV